MNRRDQLIDVARSCIQQRGYNGFSYADLAREVGIRKASIHHHFPTKGDLGKAVAERYREEFNSALEVIARTDETPNKKLTQYIGLFRHTLEHHQRACLCVMLASDHDGMPPEVQNEAQHFFNENEQWLKNIIQAGQQSDLFRDDLDAGESAKSFLSALEGAIVIAYATSQPEHLIAVGKWLLDALAPTAAASE